MSLLSPATLNVPIEIPNAEDTEIQSNQLSPIIKQFLQSFTKTSLPNLAQFLLPRRQNILSLFSSGKIQFFCKHRFLISKGGTLDPFGPSENGQKFTVLGQNMD